MLFHTLILHPFPIIIVGVFIVPLPLNADDAISPMVDCVADVACIVDVRLVVNSFPCAADVDVVVVVDDGRISPACSCLA